MENSRLKVLVAAGIYPPDAGGPAMHAKKHYEEFPRFGIETALVALSYYRKYSQWIRHLFFLFALLSKALKTHVIYAHDAWGVGFPAWFVARITSNKFILRIGGDMAWERQADSNKTESSLNEWYREGFHKNNYFFYLTRFVLKRADLIIVSTSLLSDLYGNYYGVDPKKIKIIYNPISSIESVAISTEENIIFASRLVAYKNLNFVLKTLSNIFLSHPTLKFIIMGDGPEKQKLSDLAKNLNIQDQIIFKGIVSQAEVLEETKKCLFTLAPALTEFNPNYLLQGISLNKPFLISAENGLPFEVPINLTFNPKNEQDLRKRFLSLLDGNNYIAAQEAIKNLNFRMSWDDNLRQNAEIIKAFFHYNQ